MKFIIQLSETSWIADWEGDPGRTLKLQNAQLFNSHDSAKRKLVKSKRKYYNRDFSKANIVKVEIHVLESRP